MAVRHLKSALCLAMFSLFALVSYLQFVYTNSIVFTMTYGSTRRYWKVGTGLENETVAAKISDTHITMSSDPDEGISDSKENNQTDIKTILLWTAKYGNNDFGIGFGRTGFQAKGCSEDRCFITNDRTQAADANAVLFHAVETTSDIMPNRSRQKQIWIFYNLESPLSVGSSIHGTNNKYNLTITYMQHPQTDIVTRIRKLKPSASKLKPFECLKYKTKMAIWAVSNCYAAMSLRNEYAEQLGRYLKIDVYGRCGNYSCPTDDKFGCYEQFEKDYFFYLSFENSVCDQYITEKVYSVMRRNIIPVILGGGNYVDFLPHNSYLDVRDFSSPKDLAVRMKYLRTNTTAYMEYFTWKRHTDAFIQQIDAKSPAYGKIGAFCRLCAILHDKDYPFKAEFDIEDYWSATKLCVSGDKERKALHLL